MVKKWNDPLIAKYNPGLQLVKLPITVVHRSDGSGTTFLFTSYLAMKAPRWASEVGANDAVKWPTGLGGKGNDGVAAYVKQTPGAIGYVEYAFAKQNNLQPNQLDQILGQAGLDKDHSRAVRRDASEVVGDRASRELGDGAGHLDARGPGANDHKSQQRPTTLGMRLRFRALERQEDVAPDSRRVLDALEAGRMVLPTVAAEIAVPGAGRQDQPVIVERIAASEEKLSAVGGNSGRFVQQHPDVPGAGKDRADRCRDIRRRQRGSRDLIEQWLEQMVIAPIHQSHVDGLSGQPPGSRKPAESHTDDHHPWPCRTHVSGPSSPHRPAARCR